ncbi:MAG: hypothetical protein JSS02_32060 [Planctomycetes bacterium]|nr:hypothetical protein [Planctomycetota bacterium]
MPAPGVTSPEAVVPEELRHKLWLQYGFEELSGLGKEAELTLADPDEHDRIEVFIKRLRECSASVAYLSPTFASLLQRVILPENDRPLFWNLMQAHVGLPSLQARIDEYL